MRRSAQLEHPARQLVALVCARRRGRGGRGAGRGDLVGRTAPTQPVAQTRTPSKTWRLLADAEAPDFAADGEELEFYEWAAGEVET